MLYNFLTTHRAELIRRCRAKVASRPAPKATPAELEHGIPLFMEQLGRALLAERPHGEGAGFPNPFRLVGTQQTASNTEISATASRHGMDLRKQGFTIDQVVHDYGDLCQAITELASETGAPITVDEFRTLNRCLDDAIASAVTEFSAWPDPAQEDDTLQLADRRGLLNEMNAHVQTATLAMTAIKAGNVGMKGATGAILDLSLVSMRRLIERSQPQGQDTAGVLARH